MHYKVHSYIYIIAAAYSASNHHVSFRPTHSTIGGAHTLGGLSSTYTAASDYAGNTGLDFSRLPAHSQFTVDDLQTGHYTLPTGTFGIAESNHHCINVHFTQF